MNRKYKGLEVMLLYLIRHGQSEGNIVKYDVPDGLLTPLGLQQAEETARLLQGEQIDRIIASPLRRAVQTASALQRKTGVSIEVWRDLSEMREIPAYRFLGRQGILELCPGAGFEDDYPEDGFDMGDEPVQQAHERAVRVTQRLRNRFGETDQRVAVFAHAGLNSLMTMAMMGRPFAPGCWIDQFNCCVNRFRVDPARIRVLSLNETHHLTEIS